MVSYSFSLREPSTSNSSVKAINICFFPSNFFERHLSHENIECDIHGKAYKNMKVWGQFGRKSRLSSPDITKPFEQEKHLITNKKFSLQPVEIFIYNLAVNNVGFKNSACSEIRICAHLP